MRHILLMMALLTTAGALATLLRKPHINPPLVPNYTIESAMNVPERVRNILSKACYDCHSNRTRWPWYSAVPPVSTFIETDVARGRAALNFSEWTEGSGSTPGRAAGVLAAACAAVQYGLMPKPPYPYLHPSARLSSADVEFFCAWTREAGAMLRSTGRPSPDR
jgi:hypothetical protein